jgi:hypothetical protein
MYSSFGPNELAGLSGQVERVVDGRAPRFGDPVRTLLGPPVPLSVGGSAAPVQLAARDGFAGHVRRLATAEGKAATDGVWVPESVATALKLRPGQAVAVGAEPRVRTRVAGIYQDLTAGDRPLDPFWSPLSGALAVKQVDQPPPPLLLADEPTGHQDADWARSVFEAVRWLAGRGTCCLVATHSQEFLARVDSVLTIRDGELAGD